MSQLVGFFVRVSFAFRPGSFFVQHILASVGMPLIAAGTDYACRMANPGRRVALGPEFHGDLEFWRWLFSEGLDAQGGTLSAPMYHLLERLAKLRKPLSGGSVSKLLLAVRPWRRERASFLWLE